VDNKFLHWEAVNRKVLAGVTWPQMFEELKQYCEEKKGQGTIVTSIPEGLQWTNPSGKLVKLGRWMHTQNKQRRAGKLRADRIAQIEQLIANDLFRWPKKKQLKNSINDDETIPATIPIVASAKVKKRKADFKNSESNQNTCDVPSNKQAPLAISSYSRCLAADYFTCQKSRSSSSGDSDSVALIFPLLEFEKKVTFKTGLGFESNNTKKIREIRASPTQPIPIVITLPPGDISEITEDIEMQLLAQTIAHLTVKAKDASTNDLIFNKLLDELLEVCIP
jgi:hypothetical protein